MPLVATHRPADHECGGVQRRLRRWSRGVIGSPEWPVEERLFNGMTMLNGVLTIAGAPAMLGLSAGGFLFGLQLSFGLLLLTCYIWSRRYRRYRSMVWPVGLLLPAFLLLNSVANAGTMGGAHYYLLPSMVLTMAVATSVAQRVYVVVTNLAATVGVLLVEFGQPTWLIGYADQGDRMADVASNFLFVCVLTAALVAILAAALNHERRRSDVLLSRVLPVTVLDELRVTNQLPPRYHEHTSVLFADISGFTRSAAHLDPARLVSALDSCFRGIDRITERYGLEKIKTIGDAYMATAGVPSADPDHALRCVAAALAIQAWMDEWLERQSHAHLMTWRWRIGIHSGPVVAGVIGKSRFAYDVWGDTVNVASRFESAGDPGRVNISAATLEQVSAWFSITERGCIPIKGKSDAAMFFVDRFQPEWADASDPRLPGPAMVELLDLIEQPPSDLAV